jgi:hypothetical protein
MPNCVEKQLLMDYKIHIVKEKKKEGQEPES